MKGNDTSVSSPLFSISMSSRREEYLSCLAGAMRYDVAHDNVSSGMLGLHSMHRS